MLSPPRPRTRGRARKDPPRGKGRTIDLPTRYCEQGAGARPMGLFAGLSPGRAGQAHALRREQDVAHALDGVVVELAVRRP